MTTNTKIETTLKSRVPNFAGVYNYEQLNSLRNMRGNVFVVNYVTTEEAMEGRVGHYVVIDLRREIKGPGVLGNFFFDPYALAPDFPRDILGLPNTGNVSRYLDRVGGAQINKQDFQSVKPWDSLCGVYAMLYVVDPDFDKNSVFSTNESRVKLDADMEYLFHKLKVLGDSDAHYSGSQAFTDIQKLAK